MENNTDNFNITPRQVQLLDALGQIRETIFERHGEFRGKCVSSSMFPFIKPDDEVFVQSVDWQNVRFSNIVVFKRNRQMITHRILGKRKIGKEIYFLEKGDAVLTAEYIPVQDVIGRVTAIRKSRGLIHIVSSSDYFLQYMLAVNSLLSFRIWEVIRKVLFTGNNKTWLFRCINIQYVLFFSLLARIILLPIHFRVKNKPLPEYRC